MDYAGDPGFADVDGEWIVGGPDSGGVRLFVLWRGHLFYVERDYNSETIGTGTPAAVFAATFRQHDDPRYRDIVADLDARGLSG